MDKLAVVILNWNGADMLRRFLPAAIQHSPEAVVYVADNASTDDSCKIVTEEFSTAKLIKLDENYGFAEGYNKALAQIEAQYYLLLNSDVQVTPHWLNPLLAYMDTHPETAACQPKLLSFNTKDTFEYAGACGGYMDAYGYPFCRGRVFATVEKDTGQYDNVAPVLWATGAALLVRSADFWEAGGLDGRFFAHMEEIDLCWRLRSRGHGVACVPSSTVYHVGAATLKKENPRKTFLNFRNNLLLLYKNLPEKELRHVLRIRRFLDYLAALQFLLKGDFANAKAVCKARREFSRLRNDFQAQRAENMRLATSPQMAERTSFSLLWRYYVRQQKTFSSLNA